MKIIRISIKVAKKKTRNTVTINSIKATAANIKEIIKMISRMAMKKFTGLTAAFILDYG